jgi:hypothetical protein
MRPVREICLRSSLRSPSGTERAEKRTRGSGNRVQRSEPVVVNLDILSPEDADDSLDDPFHSAPGRR